MLAAGTTLGPYKILAPLGAGGMGEVYRARDTRLARDVAVKVIPAELARDAERIKRFEQEARAAGALSHPNVCAVFDLGTHEGSPFVVMELLEGESLRLRLDAGPIPARKAIDYAAQAAHGLAAAHEKGIVHRDLKPENLFVTKDGRVKVLDFGLAKLTRPEVLAPAGEKPISVAPTETGAILGTVGYMAPEQVRGQAADSRSDLFALGAILYELLSGKRAFHGATYVETLHAILNEEPAPLSASGREMPPGLEPIVRRCLEKEPAQRFQSASDLAFALEGVSGSVSGTVPAMAGRRMEGRGRFGLASSALLVGVGLVAATTFMIVRAAHVTDASRLKYTRLTVQRGTITNALFSADGKTVFYTALWDGRPPETFETRPGFPASRALGLVETSLLSVSSDGRMAVKTEKSRAGYWGWSTLAEVPITGGALRRIMEDVQWADWSPDGRTLAVSHRVGGETRLEMPPGRVLYRTAANLHDIRISPDMRYVAFIDHPAIDFRGAMIIVDTTGHVVARTAEWNCTYGLDWSADGREVWYCGSQDLASSDLRAITTRGRERVVARFGGIWSLRDVARNGQALLMQVRIEAGMRGRRREHDGERELGWFDLPIARDISRDGRTLLFEEQGIYGGPLYAVCIRGTDGSAPVRLGAGSACALSPDGKWALAIHYGPPQRLLILPTGAGDSTSLPRGQIERYYAASWMPDGKSVVFTGSEPGHAQRSYLQDLRGGPARPLTAEGIAGSKVSPDGRLVAAVSGDQRLFICSIGGDSARFVAQLLPMESVLQWTADGRALYVGSYVTPISAVRIELATGRRTPWRTFSLPDPAGVSAGGVVLTPDGQGYAYWYFRELGDLYLVDGLK